MMRSGAIKGAGPFFSGREPDVPAIQSYPHAEANLSTRYPTHRKQRGGIEDLAAAPQSGRDLRAANVARAREWLAVPSRAKQPETSATTAADEPRVLPRPCRCCGGRMIIIETFARGCQPQHPPASATGAIEIDTS